jgi:hypothetical protein
MHFRDTDSRRCVHAGLPFLRFDIYIRTYNIQRGPEDWTGLGWAGYDGMGGVALDRDNARNIHTLLW